MEDKDRVKVVNNARIVLNSLLQGIPVMVGKEKYLMDEDYYLCVERENLISKKKVLLKVNFGAFELHHFINWVKNIPESDIFIIAANITLNEIKGKRY